MTLTQSSVQKVSLGAFYGITMFMLTAQSAFAQGASATTQADCASLTNGIAGGVDCAIDKNSSSNVGLLGDGGIFERIVNILLFLVGAISVVMLIVGGIRYVISAGDQNAVTGAKNTILYAIIGLVISFLAFAAVRFVVGALAP